MAAFSFWLIGFPLAYWLGLRTPWAATGVWIGLSAALATYAALLVWRFYSLTRHDDASACVIGDANRPLASAPQRS
jgi:multidrug resistance protein, MATE family